MTPASFHGGHRLQLIQGAKAYFEFLVQAIDASHHEVRLETYIFDVNLSCQTVLLALERAAQRGVKVHVVMDGVGTPDWPTEWAQRFNTAGVKWQIFAPLGRFGLLVPSRWRRLHRKLCVVDGLVGFCGGINLLDDWWDPNHGELPAPRFDFAVRITGPLVRDMHGVMVQLWWRLQAAKLAKKADLSGAWQALQLAVAAKQTLSQPAPVTGEAVASLVLRDNVRHRRHIERAYRQAFGDARQSIVLAHAYFLPGRKIRLGLIHAAQRGVRVQILLQGRVEYLLQHHAARALYGRLLAAGVEIHEYTPSFLHAKVAVVDGRWATVGSSNMDPLSLLLAREANVMVSDTVFAHELQHGVLQAMVQDARQIHLAQHQARSVWVKALDTMAYMLMRLVLLINGKRY